jgi:protein-S-isoprenylcysteine O-methyltransferase Ste14
MPESTFELVFLAGLIAGCVIRLWFTAGRLRRRPERPGTAVDARRVRADWLLLRLAAVGMLGLPLIEVFTGWLDFADYHLPDWVGLIGGLVFAFALWLLWRSHADLGRQWSARLEIQEGHALVTEGVYRHIRHPMYAAHFLWAIAQLLLLHNWIAGPAFLASFALLYLRRVPREEQMLLDHFAEEYRSYARRTGRIIPRLRRS